MTESSVWLPKGETGDKGPPGDKGPDGDQGPQGLPGVGMDDLVTPGDPLKGPGAIPYDPMLLYPMDSLGAAVKNAVTKPELAAGTGPSLMGYVAENANAVTRTMQERDRILEKSRVHVIDYMTPAMITSIMAGDRTVNCYPAYVAAQASLPPEGGVMILPYGTHRLDTMFTLRHGVSMIGTGPMYSTNGTDAGNTVLVPNHNGAACVSVAGANGCVLQDFTIKAYPELFPKTGLMLGRTAAASAGQHRVIGVSVIGHYSQACFYSIASEDVVFIQPYAWLFGGGAKYCFYTGISDGLAVGGLVASSNLHISLHHPFFISSATDANAACIYIEGAQAVGNFSVFGGYMIQFAGSYVQVNNAAVDGLSMLGPLTFVGICGERLTAGDPTWGIRLTAAATCTIPGLTILGCRLDLHASDVFQHFDIYSAPNIILEKPNIIIQPPEASPYATSYVLMNNVRGGIVSVGRYDRWTAITPASGWSNTLGAPYAQAAWRRDAMGNVMVRGTFSGAALGVMFVLPASELPPSDLRFGTVSGSTGAGARIRVNSATGEVSLIAGAVTEVELTAIRFNLMSV